MNQYVQVTYRAPTPEDVDFIYSSWLKSLQSSDWAKNIPRSIYFANQKKVVAGLLTHSGVLIAANPENTEQIFGYAVFQPSTSRVAVLHYLYVKHPYRKLGIGGGLLQTVKRISDHDDELPFVFTHRPKACDTLADKWNFIYNPYLLGVEPYGDEDQASEAS